MEKWCSNFQICYYFQSRNYFRNYSNLLRPEKIILTTAQSIRAEKIKTFYWSVPKLESNLINAH